jgi:hypothetical protein
MEWRKTVWTNWDCCLRFSDEHFKDMENDTDYWVYIFERKTPPAPLKRGVRSIRKNWFNFQNYWYEDDSKFQLSKHKFPKESQRNSLKGETNTIIKLFVLNVLIWASFKLSNTKILECKCWNLREGGGCAFEQLTSHPWLKENYSYNPKLKEFARQLKWFYQDRKFSLVKIKRKADMDMIFTDKKPIDNYILDFCHELMLGIEVDGYSHEFWKSMKRMEWRKNGWTNWDCCFEI